MSAKKSLGNILKALVTIGIFVGLFAEFGGGPMAVPREAITNGTAFYQDSPEMPGIVGRLKARFGGAKLPDPVPLPLDQVCRHAAAGRAVFIQKDGGGYAAIKTLRHCENDVFAKVAPSADAALAPLDAATGSTVYVATKGFQLVDIDFVDLWREVTSVKPSVFIPWFLFAILVKLSGILANVYRWKVLLDAQGVHLSFGWLNTSYWVGRYWGIVTPSTMGLDGWRLYDTIRLTRRPIECTTALAVERLIGFVSLLGALLIILPFADIGGEDFKSFLSAVKLPVAGAVIVGSLFLLQPGWFDRLPGLVPHKGAQSFLRNAITSATAYSSNRTALVVAMACAIFGQFTTMFMYVGNAYALGIESVTVTQLLAATAVMTFGTFIFPSASGEGVREFAFVAMLGGHTTAAKAFLVGHLGFWIEKLPLSIPGGIMLIRAPESYRKITRDDLDRLKAEAEAEQKAAATA